MKKKIVATLIACMLVGSLAACGSKSDDNTAAKEDDKGKGVTLNVVTTYAGNDGNAENFQEGVKAWEEETGNTVSDSSQTSDEAFKARVAADFQAGSEPDVLFYFNGVDSNSFVEAGKVVSIDDIRKEYPDYATNMKDEMLGASPVDGKNYSVPVNGYWEGLFVNKEVVEAAGVEVPGKDTTWDEFMETCQKIKDAGFNPIAASLAQVPHYWFEYTIFNHDSVKTHNTLPESVDDENGKAWVAGIEDIKTLYEKGFFPENTLSGTDDETVQGFIDGKSAFLLDGSWKVGGIEEATDNIDNFTVTYVPAKGDRKATDLIGGLSSGYYITKKAWDDDAKREAAVSFITKMTSDEMVSKFAGTSATALKEGADVDESTLTSLGKDGYHMISDITGIAGAVQDQVPTDARGPVFDGMPGLVSGDNDIKTAVSEVLEMVKEIQE
ncbi:MAG TPA: extracellular solute-binding protein [Candidatus Dorea intestinavium]|nr:extracellular solute-binding protein [Candidatus Dorea intestinavium]